MSHELLEEVLVLYLVEEQFEAGCTELLREQVQDVVARYLGAPRS